MFAGFGVKLTLRKNGVAVVVGVVVGVCVCACPMRAQGKSEITDSARAAATGFILMRYFLPTRAQWPLTIDGFEGIRNSSSWPAPLKNSYTSKPFLAAVGSYRRYRRPH